MMHYVLNGAGEPEREPDLMRWAKWLEKSGKARRVGQTEVGSVVTVSTVFLGLDHSFEGGGPPVLWETMVFGKDRKSQGGCWRCSGSREQAEAMHARVVAHVEEGLALDRLILEGEEALRKEGGLA